MAINLEKMVSPLQLRNKIFLTFDVDWAPDHMVDHIIDICIEKSLKATFFATHHSLTLDKLKDYPSLFEIGIHPNFLPGSTQGKTEEEIFNYCKELAPQAVSIRTHCVYQHGKLYDLLNKYFGSRIIDSSICMPGIENIQPFELYTPSGCLARVPFFWADDYYLLGKQKLEPETLINSNGCKVYLFHPVHIFHNTISMEHYDAIKSNIELDKFQYNGISDVFMNLVDAVSKNQIETGLIKEFLNFN